VVEKRLSRLNRNLLEFDPAKTLNGVLEFIKEVSKSTSTSGVIVGLSGGVDSTLTATLCTQALGKEKVLGVLMPTYFTPEVDVRDALDLAKMLGIRTERVGIADICESFVEALRIREDDTGTRIPLANVHARVRMIILYFFANAKNYLVAGTGDRSETLIGYFTKYGDGGADFFPIRHLYKTQVRELAIYLGIPKKMALKPSSPQLYPGHKLSDEVPLGYEKLDPVLVWLFDYELPPEKVSEMTNLPTDIIMKIVARYNQTKHKRESALMIGS
jgi:NAD+ synthase